MSKKILLVEGNNDRAFFRAFCKKLDLKDVDVPEITIVTPKDIGAQRNGWTNLIDHLPTEIKRLRNGDIDKLAIVIDADFEPDNYGGVTSRRSLITKKINDFLQKQNYGLYEISDQPNYKTGDIFKHTNGLPDIGLWIMPDHQNDGMIENFVEQMISASAEQQSLLAHANFSINNLPTKLFKDIHLSKARIYTWRAWQKEPGIRLPDALSENLLTIEAAANFSNWLVSVFK
ncbi:DUF3226 domain-containing protein [Methylomonas sp. OY6]|uniref:DUF3226 domain-containing protein n=1 Tax=Methylomonas defluvii TaxID=3045149 RepID=A0ABU4UAP9_9GAMM|nr:DUF3226 domain-containing protein [Methylomonas sp. OY6]MDX8126500.1 DUF3226 domain-containing protein [Methylomonas sp. OY6]